MNERLFNIENATEHFGDRAYVIADNFLDEKILMEILTEFPSDNRVFQHRGWEGSRVSLQYGHKLFDAYLSKTSGFKKLFEFVASKEGYTFFYNIFSHKVSTLGLKERYQDETNTVFDGKVTSFIVTTNLLKKAFIKFIYNPVYRKYNIRSRVKFLIRLFRRPVVYPLFSINYSDSGYFQPVHVDSRYKSIVGLIYLDDLDDGGELVLYENKLNIALKDCQMYPEYETVKEVARVKSKRNRLVLFLNSNNMYHGTTEFKGVRRFIYFAYAVKDEESCFETNYPVYKGDANPTEI